MKIQVCTGKACSNRYSEYIKTRLESDKEFYNHKNVVVENCMCTWNCKEWPTVYIDKELHKRVSPALASKLVLEKIKWSFQKKHKPSNYKTKPNNKK